MSTLGKTLVDEPPLIIRPSLAVGFGLNEAIVMQQLYFLLRDQRTARSLPTENAGFSTPTGSGRRCFRFGRRLRSNASSASWSAQKS